MPFSTHAALSLLLLSSSSSPFATMVQAQTQSILEGRYETTTDVSGILQLAQDVADMKETQDLADKAEIYSKGRHGRNGGASDPGLSLADLSLQASTTMNKNPYYNIYRHGFLVIGNVEEGEAEGMFDDQPASNYADTIVNDLFELDIPNIETDAVLVMNVWMVVVNELFMAARECSANNHDRVLQHLDRAIAFWVGDGEITGQTDRGHMLYNLAQKIGTRFGQDNSEGETKVNTELIRMFNKLQTDVATDNRCSEDTYYLSIRQDVKKMVSMMTVPLAQNLIHHLWNVENEDNSDLIELYALSLLPPIATCDPDVYRSELKHAVLRTTTADDRDDAIEQLQKAYSCLGITCEDVGAYEVDEVPVCANPLGAVMTGYSTGVREEGRKRSYIDRDILQIGAFIKFNDIGSAVDWYQFGWNSPSFSLQQLAQTTVLPSSNDSLYKVYQTYNNDPAFAHNMILSMLEGTQPDFLQASNNQLRLLVTAYLQYVVLFFSSVNFLEGAVEQCRSGNTLLALDFWDTAAAFYIGSVEGSEVTGSSEDAGSLLFGAAKDFCTEFGTCDSTDASEIPIAKANQQIIQGFTNGVGFIESANCDALGGSINSVFGRYMTVPLYQGLIRYASFNSKLETGQSDNGSLSIGHVFAQAVLPIIDVVDPEAATVIARNMKFGTSNPVQDGFDAVASALRTTLPQLDASCEDVGVFVDEPVAGDFCAVAQVPTNAPTPAAVEPQPSFAPAPEPTFAPVGEVHPTPETTDQLAFGRYVFSDLSVAETDARFADDVKAMFEAENAEAAKEIYDPTENPINPHLSGEIGVNTLSKMSTLAVSYMEKDDMFNIFKYSLYKPSVISDVDGEDFTYADDTVYSALNDAGDNKLAAEATVILNVWMVIVNRLYSAVRICDSGVNPSAFIDSAVALWIGKNQAEGKYDHGWMMYSVAQSASKYFGIPEGEAAVNTQLMMSFNEAKDLGALCENPNGDAMPKMRVLVDEVIRELTIPLIQSIMYHMIADNRNMVELYAVALLPQCVACNPVAHNVLRDAMYDEYEREKSLVGEVKESFSSLLRCLRITCDDLQTTTDARIGLQNFVDEMCKQIDTSTPPLLAGYAPTSSVMEESRIDLDVLQMKIFMATEAYDAAYYLYRLGRNSRKDDGTLLTLKDLARSPDRNLVGLFDAFKNYYSSEYYAHEQIDAAINQDSPYQNAATPQLQQVVERTLQVDVMYLIMFAHLQKALNSCRSGDTPAAHKSWDQAVAFYVGSIEGPFASGIAGGGGEMIFSLANELCDEFDTCASNDGSAINQDLLKYFKKGQDAIANQQCEEMERAMEWDVLPTATIPLIQGILHYAIVNEDNDIVGSEPSVAAGSAIAAAIGPLATAANATSGDIIKRNFEFGKPPMQDGAKTVFEAMTYALRGMGLDCEDVGAPVARPNLSPCTVTVDLDEDGIDDATIKPVAPHQDTETNLGDGLYVTTTYVDDRANIALDVKGMEGGLNQRETALAKVIYESGENSEVFDENGQFKSLRSLQKMSTVETNNMDSVPLFVVYKYALQDSNGQFGGRDVRLYADTLVEETFVIASQSNEVTHLPAEAAVVLNLWMFVVYTLEKTLLLCEQKKIRGEDGISAMDEAVAYWIGDGQISGDGDRGHLLYALTEQMGELFGTEVAGQARANTNILTLFNTAKNELSLPDACSSSPSTYVQLRATIYDIISQMAVPLVQGLIDSLRKNERDRVKIYAHAFVPMVAQCDPETYAYLKDKLMDMIYNIVDADEIVGRIRTVYRCLGLECADIGVHATEKTDLRDGDQLECVDPSVRSKMAGYTPTTDVREFASLDLDILQLDILLQMKAYDAAKEVYLYGKNVRQQAASGGSLGLSHLATTSERSIVPEFDAFIRYFDDNDYANTIILDAFDATSATMNDEERRLTILRASQVLVMYLAITQAINEAIEECDTVVSARSAGPNNGSGINEAWDRAAAMMIGSLEGTEDGGTNTGYLFYNIAQERMDQFGTNVIEEMVTLLFAGRGAVIGNNCDALRKTSRELSALLLVPMIQSALNASLRLTENFSAANRAEAAVYAESLIPLVENVNRDAAKTLEDNLLPPGPSNKRRIADETFAAFASVYDDLGVDCGMIGGTSGYDACSGTGSGSDKSTASLLLIVLGVVLGLAAVSCLVRLCMQKKQVQKSLPENNPTFVTSDGELNHSMDLLTKAFSSNSRGPVEREEMKGLNDASPTAEDDFEESNAFISERAKSIDII